MFSFLKEKLQKLFKKTTKEIEERPEEKEEKKESFLEKIFKPLTTTTLSEESFNKFFSELEKILIENNVAMEAIDFLKEKLAKELINKEIKRKEIEEVIKEAMKKAILELMMDPFDIRERIREKKEKPYIIVFFGINGTGKTLTIAKLANFLKKNNFTCVFSASDTFRAASIEQLEKHGESLGIKVIKHKYGADPAAVAYDAIAHAKAHSIDVVLIDTAGRMHTNKDLLREMEKICRVTKPDLKIFVGESVTGNDSVEQAKTFNSFLGIDAIILTKVDVDERGGACLSVAYVTKKPIIFLGTGQNYEDLELFDKNKIIEKIIE